MDRLPSFITGAQPQPTNGANGFEGNGHQGGGEPQGPGLALSFQGICRVGLCFKLRALLWSIQAQRPIYSGAVRWI